MDTLESSYRIGGDHSVDELGNGLKFLNIQDEIGSGLILTSGKCGDKKKGSSEKCLSKCATFPCAGKNLSSAMASVGGNDEALNDQGNVASAELFLPNVRDTPSCSRALSLPTPLKPVSAMKGTREKLGAPSTKLTVKWAPDVYDPVPTSVSHVVSNNKAPRHSSKKNGKNKKGGSKSSRGTKGKDKKQSRKHGGSSSNRGFKLLEHNEAEEMAEFCEPQTSAVEFHVGKPEQFCGSSFLRRSMTSLHFSVAEAT